MLISLLFCQVKEEVAKFITVAGEVQEEAAAGHDACGDGYRGPGGLRPPADHRTIGSDSSVTGRVAVQCLACSPLLERMGAAGRP